MSQKWRPVQGSGVALHEPELLRRRAENRKYLMELSSDKLLLHHRHEAGIETGYKELDELHGGWEHPLCQLRGHFLGHWLSAAAMETAVTGDAELKAKADAIVAELAACQQSNGGEWCASIPEKYLTLIARGKAVWAPQYTIHKTFMGLLDMYELTGNRQALDIAVGFSRWFHRWCAGFSPEEFARILDVETGGMLEVWSQLYIATGDPIHRELMDRYYRHSLFDGLLAGDDVLTNMHANTTIPEVLGAARAYEATGERKWLDIVTAYWDQAVTRRGAFCTGGQTNGEIWTPPMQLSARLGAKNQEHCTVYNMMRLADFLFRQTGDAAYADYWEQNLYNGILAQTYYRNTCCGHSEYHPHPETGLLTYFLPLHSGGHKGWAGKTGEFYCCHGSMVQANAGHVDGIYYHDGDSICVCQYFESDARVPLSGGEVALTQRTDSLAGNCGTGSVTGSQVISEDAARYAANPQILCNRLRVEGGGREFAVKIRLPWWQRREPVVFVNDEAVRPDREDGFLVLRRKWDDDVIRYEFHRELTTSPLPDRPDQLAFLIGPVALAGLTEGQTLLVDDPQHPEAALTPDNEREWALWRSTFRTVGQARDFRLIPLYEVGYETYSVYFPVQGR